MKNKIEEFRKERNLTQKELALISNVSRQTIINLETLKNKDCTLTTMKKIASALKKEVKEVFFL